MKGYWALSKIYIFVYARFFLRCHYCRKKKLDNRKILNINRPIEEKSKSKNPLWWQNSRVSYSFFA